MTRKTRYYSLIKSLKTNICNIYLQTDEKVLKKIEVNFVMHELQML